MQDILHRVWPVLRGGYKWLLFISRCMILSASALGLISSLGCGDINYLRLSVMNLNIQETMLFWDIFHWANYIVGRDVGQTYWHKMSFFWSPGPVYPRKDITKTKKENHPAFQPYYIILRVIKMYFGRIRVSLHRNVAHHFLWWVMP